MGKTKSRNGTMIGGRTSWLKWIWIFVADGISWVFYWNRLCIAEGGLSRSCNSLFEWMSWGRWLERVLYNVDVVTFADCWHEWTKRKKAPNQSIFWHWNHTLLAQWELLFMSSSRNTLIMVKKKKRKKKLNSS